MKKGFFAAFAVVISFCLPSLLSAAPMVTLEAEHADIVSVLTSIAAQTQSNIVVSDNVRGTVTCALKDIPLEDALRAVLRPNNYTYEKDGSIINVFSLAEQQNAERFSKINTRVYTFQHADVSDLRRSLMSLKSPRGRIEINAKANQVIVSDTREKIEEFEIAIQRLDQPEIIKKYRLVFADAAEIKNKIEQVVPRTKGLVFVDGRTNSVAVRSTPVVLSYIDELIAGWDVRSRQVLIEAKMLQVTLDKNTKTGIDWQYLKGKYDLRGTFPQDVSSGGIIQVGTLTSNNYTAVLELLESTSDTDVLSAPRVVVMDGKEASILVGSSEPYLVQQKDIDTGLVTTETKFIDVGIKLIVTPTITDEGYVIMEIHPEVSSARRVAEVDNALAIDTTQADTTMMIKDGDTVMLGGLMKDSRKISRNKVPILGDIPLLGYLFRNDTDEKVKQELVVFITPHILDADRKPDILRREAQRIEEITRRSMLLQQEINRRCFEEE